MILRVNKESCFTKRWLLERETNEIIEALDDLEIRAFTSIR